MPSFETIARLPSGVNSTFRPCPKNGVHIQASQQVLLLADAAANRTESILAAALSKLEGAVRWGCAVEALTETTTGVEATVVSSAGTQMIRARYVVGADGMHSLVRQIAGIGFSGTIYEESFVLADVEMS
jgi:2-polyprenyl-6-methoxyphenol hydroxylase-like FAD-dependent oxidoreductase